MNGKKSVDDYTDFHDFLKDLSNSCSDVHKFRPSGDVAVVDEDEEYKDKEKEEKDKKEEKREESSNSGFTFKW